LNANQKGQNNRNWKGDDASYSAIHLWINTHKTKPSGCEFCGKASRLEASNISGNYTREFDDWQFLCRSCHLRYDDVANKAWKTKRNR
jgi:hypothetical protein